MTNIGVEIFDYNELDESYENINWYMKLSRCHNKSTCKTKEEIDAYMPKLILKTRIKAA